VTGRNGRAQGTPLEVTGRVVDRTGRAVAGARVEIWQCDALGQYHHVGVPESSVDQFFQGFGAVIADADGRYRFQTIKPVPYPGRTPHIHFTVAQGERRRLTSQMFIEGDPGNEHDALYRRLGREARLVTMRLANSGAALRGQLDIVLE
jgi:protocatechuate 3,4-dioxygenase beta subunit